MCDSQTRYDFNIRDELLNITLCSFLVMDDGHEPGKQPGQVKCGQRFSQALSVSMYSQPLLIKQEAAIFSLITFLRASPVSGNLKFISSADSSAHAEL